MKENDKSLRTLRSNTLPSALEQVLQADLLSALDHAEIKVLYQPQFSCADGSLVGAEALSRWQHPSLGQIGAKDLFSIAEKAGVVAPLSRRVMAQALKDASQWPDKLDLSLNVTSEEIAEPSFASDFASVIMQSRIAPQRLMLEITEDVLLHDLDMAREALQALHQTGLKIALDDFGAGFCNFRYLKMLPLDALKLDRSMVEGIGHDSRDTVILRAILDLARALELDVIAEGIETTVQKDTIIAEGCAYWQGFLNSPPVESAEIMRLAAA